MIDKPESNPLWVVFSAIFIIVPAVIGYFISEKYIGSGVFGANIAIGITLLYFMFRLSIIHSQEIKKQKPQFVIKLRIALLSKDADYNLDHYNITSDHSAPFSYAILDKNIALSFIPNIGMMVNEHKIIAVYANETDNKQDVYCLVEHGFKDKEWFHSESEKTYKENLCHYGWEEIGAIGQPYVQQYQKDMLLHAKNA